VLFTRRVSSSFLVLDKSLEVLDILLQSSLNGLLFLLNGIHLLFLFGKSHFISILESLLLLLELINLRKFLLDGITKLLDMLFHLGAILFPLSFLVTSLLMIIRSLLSKILLLISQSVLKHSHLIGHFLNLILFHSEFFSGLL
jgi:hypothetical protein